MIVIAPLNFSCVVKCILLRLHHFLADTFRKKKTFFEEVTSIYVSKIQSIYKEKSTAILMNDVKRASYMKAI